MVMISQMHTNVRTFPTIHFIWKTKVHAMTKFMISCYTMKFVFYTIHFTYFFPKWKITYKKRIMTIYNKGNLRDYLIYFPLFQKRKLASREVDLPKVVTSLVMTRKGLLAVLFLYYLVLWVFQTLRIKCPLWTYRLYMLLQLFLQLILSFHLVGKNICKCTSFIWIICIL